MQRNSKTLPGLLQKAFREDHVPPRRHLLSSLSPETLGDISTTAYFCGFVTETLKVYAPCLSLEPSVVKVFIKSLLWAIMPRTNIHKEFSPPLKEKRTFNYKSDLVIPYAWFISVAVINVGRVKINPAAVSRKLLVAVRCSPFNGSSPIHSSLVTFEQMKRQNLIQF